MDRPTLVGPDLQHCPGMATDDGGGCPSGLRPPGESRPRRNLASSTLPMPSESAENGSWACVRVQCGLHDSWAEVTPARVRRSRAATPLHPRRRGCSPVWRNLSKISFGVPMDRRNFPSTVNGYLNQYVQLMDVKATAVAAAALVLIGLGLSDQAKSADPILRIVGVSFAGVASFYALHTVLPRTPHSGNGHIFWTDVSGFKSAEDYWKSVEKLTDEDIGREYARQNFEVSRILIRKTLHVRRAIVWFGAACASIALAVAVN